MLVSRLYLIGSVLIVCLIVTTTNAHAYLDPGTGSLIFQAVIGVVLGAAFAAKHWWQKIVSYFKKENKDKE